MVIILALLSLFSIEGAYTFTSNLNLDSTSIPDKIYDFRILLQNAPYTSPFSLGVSVSGSLYNENRDLSGIGLWADFSYFKSLRNPGDFFSLGLTTSSNLLGVYPSLNILPYVRLKKFLTDNVYISAVSEVEYLGTEGGHYLDVSPSLLSNFDFFPTVFILKGNFKYRSISQTIEVLTPGHGHSHVGSTQYESKSLWTFWISGRLARNFWDEIGAFYELTYKYRPNSNVVDLGEIIDPFDPKSNEIFSYSGLTHTLALNFALRKVYISNEFNYENRHYLLWDSLNTQFERRDKFLKYQVSFQWILFDESPNFGIFAIFSYTKNDSDMLRFDYVEKFYKIGLFLNF